ncbi:hypothetical protein BKN38_05730 [Helicobacter sp. CLO-3]|nr:hypothetical protein BA723_03220 [Helicobacter sp. CLO-3]OHU83207.1 hypothetical protein BKN38_05730 [Helicobacter sp. CLO-3]
MAVSNGLDEVPRQPINSITSDMSVKAAKVIWVIAENIVVENAKNARGVFPRTKIFPRAKVFKKPPENRPPNRLKNCPQKCVIEMFLSNVCSLESFHFLLDSAKIVACGITKCYIIAKSTQNAHKNA